MAKSRCFLAQRRPLYEAPSQPPFACSMDTRLETKTHVYKEHHCGCTFKPHQLSQSENPAVENKALFWFTLFTKHSHALFGFPFPHQFGKLLSHSLLRCGFVCRLYLWRLFEHCATCKKHRQQDSNGNADTEKIAFLAHDLRSQFRKQSYPSRGREI